MEKGFFSVFIDSELIEMTRKETPLKEPAFIKKMEKELQFEKDILEAIKNYGYDWTKNNLKFVQVTLEEGKSPQIELKISNKEKQ